MGMMRNDGFKYRKLSSGQILRFPESMSERNIAEIIDEHYPSGDSQMAEPEKQPEQKMVPTVFGDVPYPVKKNPDFTSQDARKAAGVLTAILSPKLKLTKLLLPQAAYKSLPALSGAKKIAADIVSNIAKTGLGVGAGVKIMGADDKNSLGAGAAASGITAGLTPFTLALQSQNPYLRLAGGLGSGLIGAYMLPESVGGGSKVAEALGGVLGALLGFRGVGASQLAQQHVLNTLKPEEIQRAVETQKASRALGLPMTLGEKSQNPILLSMEKQAAVSPGGAEVFYPKLQNRDNINKQIYDNFIKGVAPDNATQIENAAYKKSFRDAEDKNLSIDISDVARNIRKSRQKYNPSNPVDKILEDAQINLLPSRETSYRNEQAMKPFSDLEKKIGGNIADLKSQLSEIKPNYFYSAQEKSNPIEKSLANQQLMQSLLAYAKPKYMEANSVLPYENRLENLHNIKLGVRALQPGDNNAIKSIATGKLTQIEKQINQKMGEASPQYADANAFSNRRQLRSDIEDTLTKKELNATNLYDAVFKNRKDFKDMRRRLADPKNPRLTSPSQQRMDLISQLIPDLEHINNTAAKHLTKGIPEGWGYKDLAKSLVSNLYGARYNKALAELIWNPNWHGELQRIAKIKGQEDRGLAMSRLLSSAAVTGGVAYSQGSDDGFES